MKKVAFAAAILLGLLLVIRTAVHDDWIVDGIPLSTAASNQLEPMIVADGSGDAIIAWRSFTDDMDIYAQRVDEKGRALWNDGGVPVSANGADQTLCGMISDGAGGAIVVWEYDRIGEWDIYAQRIDASGKIQWAEGGVAVCAAANTQFDAIIASDGSGGAIVAWHDLRGGSGIDIYAQKVSSTGSVQWAANGVPVCTADNNQRSADIVSDRAGGAILVWQDGRDRRDHDIFAQRIDSSGAALWASNGVAVCDADSMQKYPEIVSDGSGGGIVMWKDRRAGVGNIYAQRLNASGATQWAADGVPICTSGGVEKYPQIAADGFGGAIIAWPDDRSGAYDIYAQRVSASGETRWAANGVPVCTAANAQEFPQIAADRSGGAIITWQDMRAGAHDVYLQHVSASGSAEDAPNGLPVCTAPNEQFFPRLVTDEDGDAIITWQDFRDGNDYDIYAGSR
jgi:hypothetical protein